MIIYYHGWKPSLENPLDDWRWVAIKLEESKTVQLNRYRKMKKYVESLSPDVQVFRSFP